VENACALRRNTPPSGVWKFALAFSSSAPERGLAYTDATDWWYSESTTISCTVASRASRNTAYSPPVVAAKEYLRTVSPVTVPSITTPTGIRSPAPGGSNGESHAIAATSATAEVGIIPRNRKDGCTWLLMCCAERKTRARTQHRFN